MTLAAEWSMRLERSTLHIPSSWIKALCAIAGADVSLGEKEPRKHLYLHFSQLLLQYRGLLHYVPALSSSSLIGCDC